MKLSPATWTAALFSAATFAAALWAWFALPAGSGVPVNYLGLDGLRHLGVSRSVLWVMPFVSAVVTTNLTIVGRRRISEGAALPLDMTMIAVVGVLMVAELAIIGRAADPAFNVMRPVGASVGVLLVAVGNYLGKARRNAIFGVRTPWTLADTTVWDRTHRFTGAGMVLGGLVLIPLSLLLRDGTAIGVSIGACTAIPMLAGVVRSAGLYRRLQRS